MTIASNLGFPRIGLHRELKKAQESFWKGKTSEADLLSIAKELRSRHWKIQKDAGLDHIPSNDFSLYDQVLDAICLTGAVPKRYNWKGDNVDLTTYYAMARGRQKDGQDVTAMEMTKWFDTNYHYIVPEFTRNMAFTLSSSKAVDEFKEAKAQGITTRPVILGPISFLLLGKAHGEQFDTLDLLPPLLPVYMQLLEQLQSEGAEWVQIDEPCLSLDLDEKAHKALNTAYDQFKQARTPKILLATYFGGLRDNMKNACALPVDAIHLDLVREPAQLDAALAAFPTDKTLSLGLIDGRNIWKADLEKALNLASNAKDKLGSDRLMVAASCSLLHTPVDLDAEEKLDSEIKNWMAFAKQKLAEIRLLADALNGKKDGAAFKDNADAIASRAASTRIHKKEVKDRAAGVTLDMLKRANEYEQRAKKQRAALNLPLLPTTTIGSFPQTQEVRQMRAKHKKGELSDAQYNDFLKKQTEELVRFQEKLDIDVLVHGEYERNDMVEYFGEQLDGYVFTQNGWVQSYGSRGVKPPVIFGDISRPKAMTVEWSTFAQQLTDRPMKGMLTGPVTILQWSFVRDDQPRSETCKQIGLAIRDEVADLEAAGIKVIQIDEPAVREGLPLRRSDWNDYLRWAVDCFRLSASCARDETQIHTHMCYSEFNDMIESIADLDADVISIESSRSAMELLDAFADFNYPNEIGPGVYDIHSPRVPPTQEMIELLHKALEVIPAKLLWVNPDCGLKTRGWPEVETSLKNMVDAAKQVRSDIENGKLKKAV